MGRRIALVLVIALALGLGGWGLARQRAARPIRVGVLHSLTGTMAMSERAAADATLLAIEELDEAGGVLGRPVEAVLVDGASDPETFAREAERLITRERVTTLFGCWTSAARKTMKPVVEAHDHLLIYPLQYEGLEQSPNIVYTGAAPNQQIIPAVKWALDNLGKRFFLVGSDYVFPRTANAIIRDQVTALQGAIVGEEYVPLGGADVAGVVRKIVEARPDIILNTINGTSNLAFFQALRAAGITPEHTPTISFSVAEEELRSISAIGAIGDYAAWNYFQSIPTPENQAFVERFRDRYGHDRVVDDPMEAGYFGVHLWAQAVEDAGSDAVDDIRAAIRRQSYNAPGGVVFIDPETLHTWKVVRIGRIVDDGQFALVWSSDKPVRPVPFPSYRKRSQWEAFLAALYEGWGRRWYDPGPEAG